MAFRSFGRTIKYDGEPSFALLMSFMDLASLPAVVVWDSSIQKVLYEQKREAIVLFTQYRDSDFATQFEEIAQELNGQSILFVLSGSSKDWQDAMDLLSVREPNALRLISFKDSKLDKFEMSLNLLSLDYVRDTIRKFKDGQLVPYQRSDPIPQQTVVNGKSTIVGLTHSQIT